MHVGEDLLGGVDALGARGGEDVGLGQELVELLRGPAAQEVGPAFQAQTLDPPAVVVDVLVAAADDHQLEVRLVFHRLGVAAEQQVHPLVGLEVAHVHENRAAFGQPQIAAQEARGLAVGVGQLRDVVQHLDVGRARALGQLAQGVAHRRAGHRPADRAGLAPVEEPRQRAQEALLLDHLLGDRRVHVVDVGRAEEAFEEHRDEDHLLAGVDHVGPDAPVDSPCHRDQVEVGQHLLGRKARTDLAQPLRVVGAVQRHAAVVAVFALAVDAQVHGVVAAFERAHQVVHADRRAAVDVVGVGREVLDLHRKALWSRPQAAAVDCGSLANKRSPIASQHASVCSGV